MKGQVPTITSGRENRPKRKDDPVGPPASSDFRLFPIANVFLILILFLVPFPSISHADTAVFGTITADTLWTAAASPYIVTSNVIVQDGVTLTIEPGAEVRFDADCSLQIDGTLIARGTDLQRIRFTSNQPDPAPGDWGYIHFTDTSTDAAFDGGGNYAGGSILEYATVEYGGGVFLSPGGTINIYGAYPLIHRCTIVYNTACGIAAGNLWDDSPKILKILNNSISWNIVDTSYAAGVLIYDSGAAQISGNVISHNSTTGTGAGIGVPWARSVTISKNLIIYNSAGGDGGGIGMHMGSAISIFDNMIAENTAGYNGGGINIGEAGFPFTHNAIIRNRSKEAPAVSTASNDTYTYNTITGNVSTGTEFDTAVLVHMLWGQYKTPIFNHNNLFGNSATYQLFNENNFTASIELDVVNNWWGGETEADVQNAIFDFTDDATIDPVNFTPWLTAIEPNAPVPRPAV